MPPSRLPNYLRLETLHITDELQDFSGYRHIMEFYRYSRFFICTRGSFTLQVGQETYQLKDRDACFVFINQSIHILDRYLRARPTSSRGMTLRRPPSAGSLPALAH